MATNFNNQLNVNKRGQKYHVRKTKNATGYSKHFAGKCPDKFLKLAVHGTFDTLAKIRFDFRKIRVKHPIDSEYSKVTYILKKNIPKYQHLIAFE
jgi:hypothetical protein